MSEPSASPDPHIVLQSTSTPQKLRVSQEACEQEQLLKFFIGLEMLGEKKKKRFLLYLASLQQNQEKKANEL